MFEKLERFIGELADSTRFQNVICTRGKPADKLAIGKLESLFQKLEVKLPPSMRDFYACYDGFTLAWEYTKLTHPDYITSGSIRITELAMLMTNLEYASDDLIPFDRVSDINQVVLRLNQGRVTLRYLDARSRTSVPLKLEMENYFHWLDETRGLSPWQEFFLASKTSRMKPVLREKFLRDLKLLFGDVDPTLFSSNIT